MAKRNFVALTSVISLFFIWGFFTSMNDILIPHLKDLFALNYFEAMLVQFSFFGAYFTGSLLYFLISSLKGDPINKIGYKNGIIIGLLLSALGSAMFYPATAMEKYWIYLMALFIVGLGFTMLQISANPYVAILGDPQNASSRLNFAQGFNSLGTTIGPALGGFLIFKYFAGAQAARYPYLIFAGIFVTLAIIFMLINLPRYTNPQEIPKGAGALRYPHLVLGIFAIFFYVGAEVSIGSMLINFFKLPEIGNLPEVVGATFVSVYWGGLMIGRFMGSISLNQDMKPLTRYSLMLLVAVAGYVVLGLTKGFDKIHLYTILLVLNYFAFILGKSIPGRTLGIFALVNVILLLVTVTTSGNVALWAVIGIGLFNSIMWSNIFTLAIADLKQYTAQGSSLLVMAIVGGAIIPVLQGKFADHYGVHLSYIIPVLSYVYLAFYGFYGHKIRRKQESTLTV